MKHRFLSFDSIFFRLFITFLLIMLPFEITGLVLFTWTKNTIQQEVEDSSALKVHYVKEHMETKIKDLVNQLDRLSNMNLFTQFSLNHSGYSSSEYYTSLLDQYDLIKNYPINYDSLSNVTILYGNVTKSLSAKQGLLPLEENLFQNLTGILKDTNHPIKQYKGQLLLGTMYPFNSQFTDTEPFYLITMSISERYLINYLSSSEMDYDTIIYDHTYGTSINSSSISDQKLYEKYYPLLEQELLSKETDSITVSIKKDAYYIIAEYSPYLNYSFVQFIPIDELLQLPRRISLYLFIFTLLSLIGIVAYSLVSVVLLDKPINVILGGYHSIEAGDFTVRLQDMHTSKEFHSLIEGFNKMASRLSLSIDQIYKYEIYSKRMELKQLQMQINPHFLYNTYFILHRMISTEDMESAKELSSHMGKYFQYITRNKNDLEPLEKEWDHAVNYLEIQAIRYSIRIKILVDPLPEELASLEVPRLILQPILENALEHGLNQKIEQGIVMMKIESEENKLIITISDNGESVNQNIVDEMQQILDSPISPEQDTTALVNIHRRLHLLYGDVSGLRLEQNDPTGLIVRLIIPLGVVPVNRNIL